MLVLNGLIKAKGETFVFDKSFSIRIDASKCTSLVEGGAFLNEKKEYDSWRFRDVKLESGKIYGLIGEYGQGPMYLSYLLGGKVDFGDLRLFCNGQELSRNMLEQVSWNLEASNEKYRNAVVKKSIEKALIKNQCIEDFDTIAEKFILTEPRYDRKLFQLSGERWRATAALGYANRKRIYYAPYKFSKFYYDMCQCGLLKVLKELTYDGAIVLLPAGSDEFLKHIVDECIYTNNKYDIGYLKKMYAEMFDGEKWINE